MERFIKLEKFNEMTQCIENAEVWCNKVIRNYIERLMSLFKIASNGTSLRYTN